MLERFRGYRTFIVMGVWGAAALASAYGWVPSPDEQETINAFVSMVGQIVDFFGQEIIGVILAWFMRFQTRTPVFSSK